MSKTMMTAAIAAIMATTAPLAYSQTMSPTQTTPPAERTQTMTPSTADRAPSAAERSQANAFTTQSGKLRASEIIGSTVYDKQNRDIGNVKDVLLDADGKVNAVVVDVGAFLGMGGKYVTVSLNDFKTDNNRLTLDRNKEELQSAPEFHFGPTR